MFRRSFIFVSGTALAVASAAFTAQSASAAIAVDVTGGAALIRGTWANFGYTVTAVQPIRVQALGLLDVGANGLTDPHDVGLWNSAGNLLATTVVNPNTPSSPAALQGTAWKFEPIAPIDLPAGTYKLGAFYRTTADAFIGSLNGSFASYTIDSALTYGAPFVIGGGIESFVEPTAPVSGALTPGFFGPNMQFSVIPEPTSLGLIAGLGMLIAARRRA